MKHRFGSANWFGLLVSVLAVACSGSIGRPSAAAAPIQSCAGRTVANDAELASLAGCSEVAGDLRIRNVTSLEPLAGLRAVHGTLVVAGNPELTSLDGLEGLTNVDTLVLDHNGLYTTDGLEGLRRVGDLRITDNPQLNSIAALNDVRFVGEVTLKGNRRLSGFYGLLRGLERKPSRAVVEGNQGLLPEETAMLTAPGRENVAVQE